MVDPDSLLKHEFDRNTGKSLPVTVTSNDGYDVACAMRAFINCGIPGEEQPGLLLTGTQVNAVLNYITRAMRGM